jgi:hypothetical protein
MHVSFKIHYRNNVIDKKHSYLIPRPPSWDDRNCSYGHQLYPSAHVVFSQGGKNTFFVQAINSYEENFQIQVGHHNTEEMIN